MGNQVSGSGSTGTGGTGGSTGGDPNAGNAELQQAFATALSQAQNTLIISTYGEADLNALRARPQ